MRVLIASLLLLSVISVILAASGKVGYCTSGGSDGCSSAAQVTNTLEWHQVELNEGLVIDEEEELNTLASGDRKIVVVQETVPHDGSYYAKPSSSSKTYCYSSCEWFAHDEGTNDATSWNKNQICYGCSNGYIRYEKESDGSCLKYTDLSKIPTAIFDRIAAGCKSLGGCKYCTSKKPSKTRIQPFTQISKVLSDDATSSNTDGVYVPSARTETTYNQIKAELQKTKADVQVYKEIPSSLPRILPSQASIDEQVAVIKAITTLKLTVEEWRQKFRDTFSLIIDEVHDAVDDTKDQFKALKKANAKAIDSALEQLDDRLAKFKQSTSDYKQRRNFAAFIDKLKDQIDEAFTTSSPYKTIKACVDKLDDYKENIKSVRQSVVLFKITPQQGILNALKLFTQMVDYQDDKCTLSNSSLTLNSNTFKQIANKSYDSKKDYTA